MHYLIPVIYYLFLPYFLSDSFKYTYPQLQIHIKIKLLLLSLYQFILFQFIYKLQDASRGCSQITSFQNCPIWFFK